MKTIGERIISGSSDLEPEAVRGCINHGKNLGRRLAEGTVSSSVVVRDASVVLKSVLNRRVGSAWKNMNRLADELPAAVEEAGLTLAAAGVAWVSSRAGRKR